MYQILLMKDKALDEIVFYHIEKMMRTVKEYTVAQFKANGFPVTKDQWVILKRIAEINGSTQKEIAETTFKDPAALTRILDLLEKKNLVRRQSNAADRRTFEVHLTVEGSRLVTKMTPVVQEIRSKAMKNISKAEEANLKATLLKMNDNFS